MIAVAPARAMVATRVVDCRKDRLAVLVRAEMRNNSISSAIYVVRAKRVDRIKLIWQDGARLYLMLKPEQSGFCGREFAMV